MGFHHNGLHHMMGYNSYGIFWFILTAVLLLIILFLVYKLTQKTKQADIHAVNESDALAILKERYARGELTDEEFERKKEILGN